MWRSTWEMTLEGIQYTMAPKSFWRGTQRVERGGREVAVSGKTGGWSSRPTLRASDAVPLDHQLFLLWMVFLLQRRSSNAAAAS